MERRPNEAVRRAVWAAAVPVCIVVNQDELETMIQMAGQRLQQPAPDFGLLRSRPFLAMAARTSYFPLLMAQVRRHYDDVFTLVERVQAASAEALRPWLEWGEMALSWHYPVGHLFDECRAWHDLASSLPWTITVRFTCYPKGLLPVGPALPAAAAGLASEAYGGAIGAHFYAMVKQADYIKHGTCKNVMNLTKSEQMQLWDGLWTHSYSRFWQINRKLSLEAALAASAPLLPPMKGLPVRFYTRHASLPRAIIQTPLPAAEGEALLTVGDAHCRLFPGPPAEGHFRFISHGCVLAPDTPLIWLALNFAFPDGLVHIILAEGAPSRDPLL